MLQKAPNYSSSTVVLIGVIQCDKSNMHCGVASNWPALLSHTPQICPAVDTAWPVSGWSAASLNQIGA